MSLEPRNPWFGLSCRREFLYDLRHPILFFRRGWNGTRLTFRWLFGPH